MGQRVMLIRWPDLHVDLQLITRAFWAVNYADKEKVVGSSTPALGKAGSAELPVQRGVFGRGFCFKGEAARRAFCSVFRIRVGFRRERACVPRTRSGAISGPIIATSMAGTAAHAPAPLALVPSLTLRAIVPWRAGPLPTSGRLPPTSSSSASSRERKEILSRCPGRIRPAHSLFRL
jgi:hypothetical protein